MREGIVTAQEVRLSADGMTIEVVAILDAGVVEPGMFLHIPLNRSTSITIRITDVDLVADGKAFLSLRSQVESDDDARENASNGYALDFEEETRWVDDVGED